MHGEQKDPQMNSENKWKTKPACYRSMQENQQEEEAENDEGKEILHFKENAVNQSMMNILGWKL